ncbi:MAG TPA: hypothetical protein VFK10_07360 [Burkholderiaceae bacterium]|nr:hypothetical protein [Burkholderiaceae bacterium]
MIRSIQSPAASSAIRAAAARDRAAAALSVAATMDACERRLPRAPAAALFPTQHAMTPRN